MRVFLLLALVLAALTLVDAGKKNKKPKGCVPGSKKMKKHVQKYVKSCLKKGFVSNIGCPTNENVKKPMKAKHVTKCAKLEKATASCGYACGGWSAWGAWSDCSAQCEGGTQSRSRTCDNPAPAGGGSKCQGDDKETQECNTQSCAVDGNWSEFDEWSECSAECGGGTKFRARTCNNPAPANGGLRCEGLSAETADCNETPCPVDGNWSAFSDWSGCSLTCGGGTMIRSRTCDQPAPANGGADCEGDDSEVKICNETPCSVWSRWGRWSDCSEDCAGGTQTRKRKCTNPVSVFGPTECEGDDTESRDCNTDPCPVDGNWSDFEEWSECSATCDGGTRFRARTCDNPAPAFGGLRCEGVSAETADCNEKPCPVDGNWSGFGDWSGCSLECGGGTMIRSRNCDDPAPANGGANCEGDSYETLSCNDNPCAVDGGWSPFSAWSACSRDCAGGTQSRTRACNSPAPINGGAECEGEDSESQDCNTEPCPIDGHWSPFGEWSDCSVECGGGTRTKTRTCTRPEPQFGGADCVGNDALEQECNTQECPVRYEFEQTTSNKGKWDGGAYSGYYYTVIGTAGETAEHDCETERELGGTSTCVIQDFTYIGEIKGLRIRNSGDNTWRFMSIGVKIDGVFVGAFEGYTSVDDYATVTVPIFDDPANAECGRTSLGCWSDKPTRAIDGGIRFHSDNPIDDCERYARERGFSVFAVQYESECFTAANAEETYQKHGKSEKCEDGRGGEWSFNAYTTDSCTPQYECGRQSLGCWKDDQNRAIRGGIRFSSQNPVKDCEAYATGLGFTVFAVQFGTECFTAVNAAMTYQMYGPSEDCKDGRGGAWAQNVYKTGSCPETPECSRKSLGCWKDDPLRAIQGGIRFRSDNPIEDCEKYAIENGYAVFAVQYGTECFTAPNAALTYQMYGPSERCQDGRGGGWSQNVYKANNC